MQLAVEVDGSVNDERDFDRRCVHLSVHCHYSAGFTQSIRVQYSTVMTVLNAEGHDHVFHCSAHSHRTTHDVCSWQGQHTVHQHWMLDRCPTRPIEHLFSHESCGPWQLTSQSNAHFNSTQLGFLSLPSLCLTLTLAQIFGPLIHPPTLWTQLSFVLPHL